MLAAGRGLTDGAARGCAAAGRCRAAADHTGARTGSEVPTSVREKEGLDLEMKIAIYKIVTILTSELFIIL